jgi:anti-sigma factor RsiW
MVLRCQHVWDYLSDYLDAELPDDIKLEVQRHLDHCEICSAILDSTRNIIVLTADRRVFELPAKFSERLHARLGMELGQYTNN